MNNSRFIPWFVKEAFYVFSQFVLPLVVMVLVVGGMWLWAGKLYVDAGMDHLDATPYGEMMRGIFHGDGGGNFEGKAGVRAARTHGPSTNDEIKSGFLSSE